MLVALASVLLGAAVAQAEAPKRTEVAALELSRDEMASAHARSIIAARLRALKAKAAVTFAVLPGPPLPAGEAPGESIPGPATRWLGGLARDLNMWLVAPVFESRSDGDHPYVTMVLIDPKGEIEHKARAVLPNPAFGPLPVARGNFRDTLRTVEAGGLRVGILAGNDAVPGIIRLSDLGADVIFLAADLMEPAAADRMRTLAREGNVTIAVANRRAEGGAGAFVAAASGGEARADAAGHAVLGVAPVARGWMPQSKLGLPASVPHPNRIKASPELVELGRRLFIDPRFSETGTVACASCHDPARSFTTDASLGTGVHGRQTRRNVASLVNVAYRPLLRWDGYASSLENFVKYPMSGVTEMNFHFLDKAAVLVREDNDYHAAFARLFGPVELSFDHIELALGAYLRTILSGNSAFDRYHYGGEPHALDAAQKRGLALFQGKARCGECHIIGERDALFADFDYHDLGVGWQEATGTYKDIGLGGISTAQFSGQFLTPSLRNVARTAPYMHDGSIATLRGVVDFFDRGGIASRGRDPKITPLGLSEQEKDDLVAFLQSLDGDTVWDAQGRAIARSRAASSEGASR